jgi:hypothetical protein
MVMTEAQVAAALAMDRHYTAGWRAFRDGHPCPTDEPQRIGWAAARRAVDAGRDIAWSAGKGEPVALDTIGGGA